MVAIGLQIGDPRYQISETYYFLALKNLSFSPVGDSYGEITLILFDNYRESSAPRQAHLAEIYLWWLFSFLLLRFEKECS